METTSRGRLLITLLSATLLVQCGSAGRSKTIKLAHGLDPSHPVHKAMEYMGQLLLEKSQGRYRLEIYPSGQLGTERECIELLQIGSLGMTKVSSSVLEGFVPAFNVFSLPYLFRDDAHRWAVLEGPIGQRLLQEGERFGLHGLCFFDAGSRSFYTKEKPILTPDDLRGLKIRTQESPTSLRMIKALGGSATPIAWGELYTALQQGVVDGAENNPPTFHLSHHYEVCKYYSLDEHTAVPDVLLISNVIWKRLPAEARRWIQEAAAEAAVYQRELWRQATQTALEEVQKAGVKVIYPEKTPFQARVGEIYATYQSHPELSQLIAEIKATP